MSMKNLSILLGVTFLVTSLWASSQFFFGPSDDVDDNESTTEETLDTFSPNFDKLKKIVLQNKRLPSSKSNNPDEKRLASWCSSMRTGYKNGHLSVDKIASLECIPYWTWDPIQDKHRQMVSMLQEFVATHVRQPSVTSSNQDERILAKWCINRKRDYRRNRLSKESIMELEAISMWHW